MSDHKLIPGIKGIEKNIFLFILLILLSAVSNNFSQDTEPGKKKSLEDEILSQPETDLMMLGKSRAFLLHSLKNNDTLKADEIWQFMKNKFDSSKVVILYPLEEVLLGYLLQQYDVIFSFAKEIDYYKRWEEKLYPQPDLLHKELMELSRINQINIAAAIQNSVLESYEKDFLLLLLKYILIQGNENISFDDPAQKSINLEADEYLRTYKDSEYLSFIRNHIRYVIKKSDWGFGFELAGGYLALPDKFGSYIKDFGLLTIGFESAYKELYAGLRLDIGAAHNTKKEFIYDGTWKEGLLLMHTGVLFSFGYMLDLGNNFFLTPQLGAGASNFSPPEKESDKEGNDVSITLAVWAFGINLDIPLAGVDGQSYLRANLGYRTAITNIDIAKGGYTFFTIGYALFGRPSYRDL